MTTSVAVPLWRNRDFTLFWTSQVASTRVVAGVGALFGPPFNVVIAAYVYRVTPDELMGRVRSAIRLVAWGTIPVGSLLGGVLSEALGPGPALLVFALGMLPVAVATTLSRGMREISAAEPRPAPET